MNNFLTYIDKDTEIKKEIIKSSSTKTKTQRKALKTKIEEYKRKYNSYKENVTKYIDLKSKSIELKDIEIETKENLADMKAKIHDYKLLAKSLSPQTTYFEKLGFDNLLFKLGFYNNFDFVEVNKIINELSSKFKLINISLSEKYFKLTPYVYEYMKEFYREANRERPNFFLLEKSFEKIYWVCPNIIKHIELNFRILCSKYSEEFTKEVTNIQIENKRKYGIHSYEECMKELKRVHYEYTYARKESLQDIIDMAIKGEIDINEFFEDSKTRLAAENVMVIQDKERNYDENSTSNHENLKKLRNVLIEYSQYVHFIPYVEYNKNLFDNFKLPRPIKEIEEGKEKLETGMKMINKIIFDDLSFTEKLMLSFKNKELLKKPKKQLVVDVTTYADKLLAIYQGLDSYKFYNIVKGIVNEYVTLDDFLTAFRDFEYFKKKEMKDTYNVTTYDELMEHIEKFDIYCNNPNNLVISSVPVYQEYNVAKVIVDKYRINNYNLTEELINPNNIDTLLSYIDIFIRSTHIEACNLTIQQIWFIVEANKIMINNKKD